MSDVTIEELARVKRKVTILKRRVGVLEDRLTTALETIEHNQGMLQLEIEHIKSAFRNLEIEDDDIAK